MLRHYYLGAARAKCLESAIASVPVALREVRERKVAGRIMGGKRNKKGIVVLGFRRRSFPVSPLPIQHQQVEAQPMGDCVVPTPILAELTLGLPLSGTGPASPP